MSLPNFTEFRLFLGSPDSNEGTGIFRPILDAEKKWDAGTSKNRAIIVLEIFMVCDLSLGKIR